MTALSFSLSTRLGFAVDRALSLFAPSYAVTRMESRQKVAEITNRMYAAAKATNDSNGWMPVDADVNSIIRTSSYVVRARVRQLVRDFPYAKRAIKLRTAFIIGNGIRMQARLRKKEGSLDESANTLLESEFAEWAQKADTTGKLSFADLQALAERQLFECGEYFFIKHFVKGQKNPFRLQPIEADRLSAYGANVAANCKLESGIEYEKATGKPVAYHFTDDGYSAKTIRVPADMVIHGYEVERPGQMRGISPIASSVMVAGNLADLLAAELEAMRMSARYMAFVRSSAPPAMDGKNGKGKIEHFSHATIQYLRNGDDVTLAKIDRQSGTFEPYIKLNLRTFSVGAGLTYELVSGDYDHISYSNLRGIRNDLRAIILPLQNSHINWLCKPAITTWAAAGMLTNPYLIRLASRITPSSFKWIPPGMDSPDQLREIKAAADEIRLGITSPQELCTKKGRKYSEVLDEIAEAIQLANDRNLTLGDVLSTIKNNPAVLMEDKNNA